MILVSLNKCIQRSMHTTVRCVIMIVRSVYCVDIAGVASISTWIAFVNIFMDSRIITVFSALGDAYDKAKSKCILNFAAKNTEKYWKIL